MKVFSSKRRVATLALLALLALFLVRPGASRLKSRVINSLSAAVGRSVDIGSVHIRVLPRPGFDLENLVVYDDPAFGSEPMLRASEVPADLRLISLIRGRLEVSIWYITWVADGILRVCSSAQRAHHSLLQVKRNPNRGQDSRISKDLPDELTSRAVRRRNPTRSPMPISHCGRSQRMCVASGSKRSPSAAT